MTVSLERIIRGLCMSSLLHERPGFTARPSLKSELIGVEVESVQDHGISPKISTAMD